MNYVSTTFAGFTFHRSPYLLKETEYQKRTTTKHLVVHCADTKASWNGGAEEIREWHTTERGWSDIGYHYVIRRDGTMENGRPVWSIGAGVAGHNADTIHVCLVGGQAADGSAEDNFTAQQKASLAFLLGALKKYVAPDADVMGHRDFPGVTKQCPSFDARAWWRGEGTQKVTGFAYGCVPKAGEQFFRN